MSILIVKQSLNAARQIVTGFLIVLFGIILPGCGNLRIEGKQIRLVQVKGPLIEEIRSLPEVRGIELKVDIRVPDMPGEPGCHLLIQAGDPQQLWIRAPKDLLQYIETEINGRMLEIRLLPGVRVESTQPIYLILTVDELDQVSLEGASEISAQAVDTDELLVNVARGGRIKIARLTAKYLNANLALDGRLEIGGGRVERQRLSISLNGSYLAGNLVSQQASLDIAGYGEALVWVIDDLRLKIVGSGKVSYYGKPSVNSLTVGSKQVTMLGAR